MYYLVAIPSCEKENAPEGPTQNDLHEIREQDKHKPKMKNKTV